MKKVLAVLIMIVLCIVGGIMIDAVGIYWALCIIGGCILGIMWDRL